MPQHGILPRAEFALVLAPPYPIKSNNLSSIDSWLVLGGGGGGAGAVVVLVVVAMGYTQGGLLEVDWSSLCPRPRRSRSSSSSSSSSL